MPNAASAAQAAGVSPAGADLRQAISHAIDREGIAQAVYFGHAVPTYGPIASNWKWYEAGVEQFNQFDPDTSRTLLDEAGYDEKDANGFRVYPDGSGETITFEIEGTAFLPHQVRRTAGALVEVGRGPVDHFHRGNGARRRFAVKSPRPPFGRPCGDR